MTLLVSLLSANRKLENITTSEENCPCNAPISFIHNLLFYLQYCPTGYINFRLIFIFMFRLDFMKFVPSGVSVTSLASPAVAKSPKGILSFHSIAHSDHFAQQRKVKCFDTWKKKIRHEPRCRCGLLMLLYIYCLFLPVRL